jgi:type I restriction enzyme M protein
VWFYQINNDGYDPDKITGGGRPETPERNDIPEMVRQWRAFKESGFKKPPGTEAGALLPPGTEEVKCWWARISTIAENDFNLAAGRYKPQVAEKAPEEDPAELISKTLKVEREIASGLEKLLKQVEES